MLAQYLNIPWRRLHLTEDDLRTGLLSIWYPSDEPCPYPGCIYYEQHLLLPVSQPLINPCGLFAVGGPNPSSLYNVIVQYDHWGICPATECLPDGFFAQVDPLRRGTIRVLQHQSLLS